MLSVLPVACRFELRALVRNRVGVMAVIAYLSIGMLALFLGNQYVAGWQQSIEIALQAQHDSIAEARGYLATGSGPVDRPWVDLSQPRWQDYYAGTRVIREPGSLAGIAAGSVDPAPVSFQVNQRADPSAGGGYRIDNPELAMGSVDLAFVVAILSPLLIGVLGVGIGGREREERIDRLIVVQLGGARDWLLARLIAVTGLAVFVNVSLGIAAGLVGRASLQETVVLVAFGGGYAAVWGGILGAVSAQARSVRAAALTFGAVWMSVCIVLPTIAAEISLAQVQTDFGVAETLDARSLSYAAYERSIDDVTAQVYAHYPELTALPAAFDEELDPSVARHATNAVLVAAMAERVAARQTEARDAQRFAERVSWASPAVALTLAFERLAGVGPEAASAFQEHTMKAVEGRVVWILRHAWHKAPLTASDFDALVGEVPGVFRWKPSGLGTPWVALVFWGVAAWLVAVIGLRRAERRG